jgi:hypothetical protein
MKYPTSSIVASVSAAFALLLAAPASADIVSDINAIAVQATTTACPAPTCMPAIAARPGPTGVLDIAMVHAAVYDAVQAIENQYQPYKVEIIGASGSPEAAAAKAAHDVLVNRFPWQVASLDTTYALYLASHGLAANDPGVAVGANAAAGIIALRSSDGSFPVVAPPPFTGGTGLGDWRPTPPALAPMLAPWLGAVTPFTMTRASQFRAPSPPDFTSREYARDYNEVMNLGALNSSTRTPAQTDMANFWNLNYVVVLNQVLRDIANEYLEESDIAERARLFALADMAMADSIIASWNSKNYYVLWRPSTAILEGNNDGNSLTAGDPTWLPLIANPPYPDYTSGANNIASSLLRSLELFFDRDRMDFAITTTNVGPTIEDTRYFKRFSDAREEVVNARIYEGIHFRFADEAARKQGKQIAGWAFENYLRPLDDDQYDYHGNGK